MTADEAYAILQAAWAEYQRLGNGITQISEDVVDGTPDSADLAEAVLQAKGVLAKLEQIEAAGPLTGTFTQ
jgi:hypothetical protein